MPLKDQTVMFPGVSVPQLGAYLITPDGDGPFPGVVVIHEAYGLNDNIQSVAQRFAEQGYAAMAVDLFAGRNKMVCMARFMGGLLFNSLENGGIKDLKASLDYLSAQPQIDKDRIGAIGFCMGGSFAIAWACTDQRLKAIAPYYGINPRPLDALSRVCPVVGSYPQQDFSATGGKVLDLELDKYNVPHDIKIYPGAKHSFFNDQGSRYDPAAAEDSWTRVLAFFKSHILSTPENK